MDTNKVAIAGQEGAVLHAPVYAPVKENEQVLLSLGITADHIAALPMIVNTGEVFLLQEIRNLDILQSLRPVPDSMRMLADLYQLSGYCLFCRQDGKEADATARYFALSPAEPAAAPDIPFAGALACYLYDIAMIKKDAMIILHDHSPNLPGVARLVVHLHTQRGKIQSLDKV